LKDPFIPNNLKYRVYLFKISETYDLCSNIFQWPIIRIRLLCHKYHPHVGPWSLISVKKYNRKKPKKCHVRGSVWVNHLLTLTKPNKERVNQLNSVTQWEQEEENGKVASTIGSPPVTVKRRQATKPWRKIPLQQVITTV